ncbi:hypothetical protein TGRUB_360030 [Toxoplasma gondii RUB]|uniref:Uncharacterized protein n=1 Tax=Toxoplasma gondii RUB TaxID=935652 RepID=A0A086LMA8_TOXGO|nr:hypothetical protein TGRUB_360030 [Toxoplasma gondii RUB]
MSTQNASSTSAAAAVTDLPAYTFEVVELPKDETQVCCKCIEKVAIQRSPPQDLKKCKIVLKVSAAKPEPQAPGSGVPPPPPGDGGNQNLSAPHQQGTDSNPGLDTPVRDRDCGKSANLYPQVQHEASDRMGQSSIDQKNL